MNIRYLSGAAVIIFAFLIFFTRSFTDGIKLGAAAILLWLIPGYVILHYLFNDLAELEKVILALFVGFGATALILYYLNVIGLKSITPIFSYGIGILSLAALVLARIKSNPQKA